MFRDRDIIIMGIGGLLAVATLIFPFPLAVRFGLAVVIIFLSVMAGLLRVGADRVPPEQWVWRRLRFAWRNRRYVFREGEPEAWSEAPFEEEEEEGASTEGAGEEESMPPVWRPSPTRTSAISLSWYDLNVGPAITVAMVVIAIYIVVWLSQGGAEELGQGWALLLGR